MTEPRDPLLVEREKTHGSFQQNALVSQQLKGLMQNVKDMPNLVSSYHRMAIAQREALDMIALKLSRILSGQANFKDHWKDISGYSLLAMEACDEDASIQK